MRPQYRSFPLDGALLLFDRETGTNVLLDGDETAGLRQQAPRSVQFAITNRCNLACAFCSRDLDAASAWTVESAFSMLAGLASAGVLEVAFGGGEPLAFAGFADLVSRLRDETPLAVHATTNGLLLSPARILRLRGKLDELRLSLYDDNDWRSTVARLADAGMRFGVNLLVLPDRLPALESVVLDLVSLGCRDVLLLSYNGAAARLHLSTESSADLARRVAVLHRALGRRCRLSIDVCWGERMAPVPRYFGDGDCGAGRMFVVLTSDKRLSPCSFHHLSYPVETAGDVMRAWREQRHSLAIAARDPGCARTPGFGLESQ